MADGVARSAYGVKLVRGPVLRLDPHPDHCQTVDETLALIRSIRAENPDALFAADLFSGAGGLSLGLRDAGFNVVVGVDHYPEAVETHRHHFSGLTVDWDLAEPDRIDAIAEVIREGGIDLVAGGPPCQPFSKAGRSIIRHRVHQGMRDPHDERRDLWRSYFEVVRLSMPRAVLMENVPDMALDKEMFILRSIVEELEQLGYSVEERVVDTWRYGVPQFRQRLILVALRDGIAFDWPAEVPEKVTVWNAIGEMPPVEGGWRPEGGAAGWIDYDAPVTAFQRRMRANVPVSDQHKLFDHITRPVRADDAKAFALMDSTTRYSDLPVEVKRYREDIFDDKYKRLDENDLSRTITAHIAKDGYWYIHPREGRTLTVREAARLQTFPDSHRFAGPPSAAFKQIGNAVPPFLGFHLGRAITAALSEPTKALSDSRAIAASLTDWWEKRTALRVPWLRAKTRWQVVAAEILLDRAEAEQVRLIWPVFAMYETPEVAVEQDEGLRQLGMVIGREKRVVQLLELADWLTEHPGSLDEAQLDYARMPTLTEAVADVATLVVPTVEEEVADEPVLVTKGVLRVASRFWAQPVDRRNRLTDGRLAVARMIGGGSSARAAHLALIELANSLCRPTDPVCLECPLSQTCRSSQASIQRADALF
jgi:DNA (cytosine-5)-methyltransferase 1